MVIIQSCINKSGTLTEKRKKLFHSLFNAIIIATFCEWIGNYLQGTGGSTRVLHIMVKATELSVAPAIGIFVSWVIEKRLEKVVYLCLIVNTLLEWLSGYFGFIYYVDANSNYGHGTFYWIYILAYMGSILYCIYVVLCNVKQYQYNGIGYFLLIVLFMITGIVIQLADNSLKVDYITIAMASIMLYVLTLEMINQTDELTELLNRRGFENYITHLEQKCVILFFDVDRFKTINDTYGHAFGDEVLKNIGRTIRKQYARYGKCFRVGGDEFCVVMTGNLSQIEEINEKFLKAVEQLKKEENRFPGVSVGYAYYEAGNQNIQDAVTEADQMMYRFKQEHRE